MRKVVPTPERLNGWLPRGADNADYVTSDNMTLSPGVSVRYGDLVTMEENNVEEAAQALADAAHKDVSERTVRSLNDILGIEADDATVAAVENRIVVERN